MATCVSDTGADTDIDRQRAPDAIFILSRSLLVLGSRMIFLSNGYLQQHSNG